MTQVDFLLSRGSSPNNSFNSIRDTFGSFRTQSPFLDFSSNTESLEWPLSSPANRLVARFVQLTGLHSTSVHPLQVLGNFIALIPSRIGASSVLDSATTYFLDSLAAYKFVSSNSKRTTRLSGLRALNSLRAALLGKNQSDSNVILAVRLHLAAELFMGVGSVYFSLRVQNLYMLLDDQNTSARSKPTSRELLHTFYVHARGLCSMLTAEPPVRRNTELYQDTFQAIYLDEVIEGMFSGRDSIFDNDSWQMTADMNILAGTSASSVACSLITKTLIQLPRLGRLIRESNEKPLDSALAFQACRLAEVLFENEELETHTWMRTVFESFTTTAPTSNLEWAALVPKSYQFESIGDLMVVVRYCTSRLFLCGLIQTLCASLAIAPPFDLTIIHSRDIEAARTLAMCVQWAQTIDPSLPLVALKMLFPMQISYGAWDRLQEREIDSSSHVWRRAQNMKDWILNVVNDIQIRWAYRLSDHDELEQKVKSFAGGPLCSSRGQRLDWISLLEPLNDLEVESHPDDECLPHLGTSSPFLN